MILLELALQSNQEETTFHYLIIQFLQFFQHDNDNQVDHKANTSKQGQIWSEQFWI